MRHIFSCRYIFSVLLAIVCGLGSAVSAANAQDPIEQTLLARIEANPQEASNWRLLGRHRLKLGNVRGAIDACHLAWQLDPENASTEFDLGNALLAGGDKVTAISHLKQAYHLAPTSEYGEQASLILQDLGEPVVTQASLEREEAVNRFAGEPIDLEDEPEWQPLRFRVETGLLYNSNVQLAPVSRVVSTQGLASWQGFIAPDVSYRWRLGEVWQTGVAFRGYFSRNQAAFDDFNLQDYQPGAFFERTIDLGDRIRTTRFQYDFTLDEFAGQTFATRHSFTSLYSVERMDSMSLVYWTIDFSNFTDDGVDPQLSSLDGWTHTLGASHAWFFDEALIDTFRTGVDVQWADLKGDNFAYQSLFLYGEVERPMVWDSRLVAQAGWGPRNYQRFTSLPSRDEMLWRAGVEWQKPLSDAWTLTVLANYQAFNSENDAFRTDRLLGGLKLTWQW